ncbi:MAG: pro-sigmaK processing inhibitor BofA family protein [Clostridia bacterium]|nr:pro-sigmaK processing inhibitor BofA family protein [Clostridia bacterium]
MYQTVIVSIIAVYIFAYFILAVRTQKPFKTMLFYSFIGVAVMFIIKLTAPYTGVNIPLNEYTLATSAGLSIPGTIMLLVLKILFI